MRVLIAEDDALGGLLLERAVKNAGHQTERASDGLQALASALATPFDAVLVDLVMPGMDGHDLMRALRLQLDPVPILIVTTALTSDEARTRALESGADEYVTKPFDPRRVVEVLEFCRARRQQRPSLPAPSGEPFNPAPAPFPCVVMVAGTGGPSALRHLLAQVGNDPSLRPPGTPPQFAVLIVQHAPSWLLDQLVKMLQRATSMTVQLAQHGDQLRPGMVLLAPADRHLVVDSSLQVRLEDDPPENLVRPSADPLFRSAARAFGPRCVAVVLGGMGCDGAYGAAQVAQAGGRVLVQDPEEADSPAMPRGALSLGVQASSVKLQDLGQALTRSVGMQN